MQEIIQNRFVDQLVGERERERDLRAQAGQNEGRRAAPGRRERRSGQGGPSVSHRAPVPSQTGRLNAEPHQKVITAGKGKVKK